MKNYLFALVVALVAGLAHADGVPLLSRPTKPVDPVREAAMRSRAGTAEVYAVTVNPHAMDSNVITVIVEGKQYRFVGKIGQPDHGYEAWGGSTPQQDMLILTRPVNDKTSVIGGIFAGGQNYDLQSGGVLVKSKAIIPEFVDSPQKQAERARRAEGIRNGTVLP